MRYYNKVDGLEFLKRHLKGVRDVSVLPWRVYRDPGEFRARHFWRAERLLLRTDFDHDLSYWRWRQLPRDEAAPAEARAKLMELAAALHGGGGAARFIVHPVAGREKYVVYGQLRSTPGGGWTPGMDWMGLALSRPEPRNRLWRWYVGGNSSKRESLRILQDECGLSAENAEKAYATIERAHAAILRGVEKEGFPDVGGDDRWEASFAVHVDKPTRIEFYDFLRKEKTDFLSF